MIGTAAGVVVGLAVTVLAVAVIVLASIGLAVVLL